MSPPVIRLAQGTLRGRWATTRFGRDYVSFQGIPYAKAPVGPLRFKPPKPAEPWEGVRDALKEGADCPQQDVLHGNICKGDEDSLFLNVYTLELPGNTIESKKAVMVWFHGGGFGFGSGSRHFHGPDYLVEGDVVLVTVNYRLGPLGFLSLPDAGVAGNNGLKDQVMALQWVQQNISQFGGDPNNVTIFGTSAGGASVQYHLLSPMSKGLFHHAIAQSGSVLNPWAYDSPATARDKAFRLGQMLGHKTDDPKQLLEFLQNLSAKEILEGLHNSLTDEDKLLLTLYCLPTCDKTASPGEVFLPDSPYTLLADGKFQDVPYLTGIVSHEGMLMLKEVLEKPSLLDYIEENFEAVLPWNLVLGSNKEEIVKRVKRFYFGDGKVSRATLDRYIELNTDAQFHFGVNYTVRQHLAFCKSPIFFYQFSFDGKLALLKKLVGAEDFPGACHGDDTAYVFNPTVLDVPLDSSMTEVKIIKRITKMWTNFAKTGNPTPEGDPLLGINWTPVGSADLPYLNINKELSMGCHLRKHNTQFWDEIYQSAAWKSNTEI